MPVDGQTDHFRSADPPGTARDQPSLGLRDGVPVERITSRKLETLGAVEIARHCFLPGETAYPPLPGHLINLHLGPASRIVTRRDGRAWEGVQPPGSVEVLAAHGATEQTLLDSSNDASVLLADSFLNRIADSIGIDPSRVSIVDRLDGHDPQIERLLLMLMSELESDALGGELYVESLATALAIHLLRHHSSLSLRGEGDVRGGLGGGLAAPQLRRVVDYIDAHLTDHLSLDELAGIGGLSPRHFLRQFRKSTGLSPHQYVIRARVERAKTLLAGSAFPIAEIAGAAGFAHQQHLIRHFRRCTGVTPGRYRASASR